MPRNGSGTYSPPSSSWNPAVDNTTIDASDFNDLLTDLSNALTASLTADGQTTWTADQNAGGYKLTGLASGTTSGDALAYQQIGAQVQGYSATLAAIAALTPTDSNFVVGNGTTWVAESGATVRASLGLVIGTDVQAYDADLSAIAALTSAANKMPYATGAQTWALTDFTAAARSFVGQADLSATDTAEGLVELATTAETQALSSTSLAVTPGGLSTIGVPVLLETLATTSGATATTGTLPTCRAFLLLLNGVSGSSTATISLAVSDDDGASFDTARQISASNAASTLLAGPVWVYGGGVTGTKYMLAQVVSENELTSAYCNVSTWTTETGATNKLRFSISAGAFDAGEIFVFGVR